MAAPLLAQHTENPEHRRPGPFTYGDYPRPVPRNRPFGLTNPSAHSAVSRTDSATIPENACESAADATPRLERADGVASISTSVRSSDDRSEPAEPRSDRAESQPVRAESRPDRAG